MSRRVTIALAGVLSICVAGCQESAPRPAVGSGMEFRMEEYCAIDGLPAALRHTFVLIDERTLMPSDESERAEADETLLNDGVRESVLAFADPLQATQTGATDYRERVTLLLVPRSGAAAEVLFEGCVPGLSPDELAEARQGGSAIESFFTGGLDQRLQNDRDEFRRRVALALGKAAREAEGEATPYSGNLAEGSLVASLRASGQLINADEGLPRIVILSNLARIDLGEARTREAAREQGFRDGAQAGLDLGRSEVHVFLVDGRQSALARDYAEAFFLTQQGRLLSWSGDRPTNLPPAPVSVARFEGEARFVAPDWTPPVWVRIALDRNGSLVNSWITLRGNVNRSTPFSGIRSCNSEDACTLRADETGFAQVWRNFPDFELEAITPAPTAGPVPPPDMGTGPASRDAGQGGASSGASPSPAPSVPAAASICRADQAQPEFCPHYPFVGVRSWEMTVEEQSLTGRLFDPSGLQIGLDRNNKEIGIEARQVHDARF
jgi:hypothetical protein